MKKSLLNLIACVLFLTTANAQVSFVNTNSKVTNAVFHSGVAITVADMNGDGLDDIARLANGHDLYIEYQVTGGQFQSVHIADFDSLTFDSEWGMCVADVDHNGYKDVLAGGNNSQFIQIMKIGPSGIIGNIIELSTSTISGFFMQNSNFMDVNNDGWEDIFVCNDNGPSLIWTNDGAGNFAMSSIIDFAIHPWILTTGGHGNDPADAGNYGSVWTDFDNDGDVDLYVAHCRQGVNSSADPRRVDQLFVNDGNNNYTQMDTVYGVADSMETWTASFGDIDNDADLDLLLTEQDGPSRVLENDGAGHFSEITSTAGVVLTVQAIESVMEDFDNDGYIDILVTGYGSQFFHNNGNKTFTEVLGLFDNNDMESFAIGDLNHDGKVDIYGGYGQIYTNPTSINDVIWINNSNAHNNFISFHLEGTTSNMSALGARVILYGAMGKQLREVRSGESYGTCNSGDLHFGLGSATSIDSAVVLWPSGTITTIVNPVINQFITVKENTCISPNNVVTANGPMVLCTGQSVTLNAPAGYDYYWSDGSSTQSITVSTPGEYGVVVSTAGNACTNTSAVVTLIMNPDETPMVTASTTDLNVCQGTTITLTSSAAASYTWSNGATTQSTTVSQTGSYTVMVAGACQNWTSAATAVNVYPAPLPVASDVTIPVPGTATLNATGNNIYWYDVPTGGTSLYNGPSYTTPFLNTDFTYYIEDAYSYGGGTGFTGQPIHTGASAFSGGTTNAYEIFNVLKPCVLKTVKVYTDAPGDRIIELRDANDVVLQSITVNIPIDSSTITLNFNLAVGTNYHIGTNEPQNQILLGTTSPRLQRSNAGVSYPYTLNNYVSVTNSDQGNSYYYYFYNWEIEEPATVCLSARVPVSVDILSVVGINDVTANHVGLYPNPANNKVNVTFNEKFDSKTSVEIVDVSGRVLSSQTYEHLSNGQIVTLDVSKYAAGSYLLNIKNDTISISKSLSILQ